jgi:hypothetical protein
MAIDFESARRTTEALVGLYAGQAAIAQDSRGGYSEEQARVDFIDPLLKALGWDLTNDAGIAHSRREVVVEPTITGIDHQALGRPDYTLRPDGTVRLFVEAKRPSLDLDASAPAAIQVRTYGWTGRLSVSVLTNFRQLAFYDTRHEPNPADNCRVARFPGRFFDWTEYLTRFSEIWDLLSRESVGSERFFDLFGVEREYRGTDSFDARFLDRIRGWRRQLAQEIASHNPAISASDVGRRTQQLLNSLVFLRVCEDRSIEGYQTLKDRAHSGDVLDHFRRSDQRFNAGLFQALDGLAVSPAILKSVIDELYYPSSNYAFSVVEPAVLAQIYEQFLGERVEVDANRAVRLTEKPEVTHAGGVVPTPGYLVDRLLDRGLAGRLGLNGDAFALRICDPACGSGAFLLAAFKRLLEQAETSADRRSGLGLAAKRELLRQCIYGVDIDDQAVEVSRLSLLLELLSDETPAVLAAEPPPLLPDLSHNIQCGNSLVDSRFYGLFPEITREIGGLATINVFDWNAAFPEVMTDGGFNLIVGNPPWVRIQVLSEHYPDQLRFFQREDSGYRSGRAFNFDLYLLFVERALQLLRDEGTAALLIPHRFMTSMPGAQLRLVLSRDRLVREIVHFGYHQLFPGRTNYVCFLILDKKAHDTFRVDIVGDLDEWLDLVGTIAQTGQELPSSSLGPEPWVFVPDRDGDVFTRLRREFPRRLGEVADIFVGVQTSADDVFFLAPVAETMDAVECRDATGTIRVLERSIVRPALRDRRLRPFDFRPIPDYWAIFPYERSAAADGRMRPIPIDRFEHEFPLCWAYLTAHRGELEARDVQGAGDEWYRYGRSQSLGQLDEPKIIVRVLSTTPQYCYDPDSLLVPGGGDGGPYYLIRPHDNTPEWNRYLIAVLSHPVIDALVVATGRSYRGGYFVHRKAFLQGLPIPEPGQQFAPIAEAVERLHQTVESLRTERDSKNRRALERLEAARLEEVVGLVSDLLRLTPDERSVFEV